MKNKIAQFLMLAVLTLGLTAFAQAQTGSSYKADIPFDFVVGEKQFKAGEYSISFGIIRNIPESFLLRSADGKHSAIVTQIISERAGENIEDASLVFVVSNEHYFLTEVNSAQTSVEVRSPRLKKKAKKSGKRVEVALAR